MNTTRILLFAAATALFGCGASSVPPPVAAAPPPPPPVATAAPATATGGGASIIDSEPAPGQPHAKVAPRTGNGPDPSEIISETKRLRDRSRPCIRVAGQLRTGRIKITIGTDGRALVVELNGHLKGTPEGGCVTAAFRDFHVAPFAGEPVTVKVSVSLP